MTTTRSIARAALVAVVAVVLLVVSLPLVVVWLCVLAIGRLVEAVRRALEPRVVPWNELIEYQPEVGWRTRTGVQAAARADRVFRLSTDALGWRGPGSVADSDVVVFGDSFAFGWGVDDREHFASIATRLDPRVRVKAVGAIAYNMVQELVLMEQLGSELRGKTVVWLVYVANDITGNLLPYCGRYRAPFVRLSDDRAEWEIVSSHLSPEPWPWPRWEDERAAHRELCCLTARSRRAYDAARALVARAHDLCERFDARLVVMSVPGLLDFAPDDLAQGCPDPSTFDPDRPHRQLAAICDELGVVSVDLRDHLARHDYKAADVHWSESGHRRVAEAILHVAAPEPAVR
jgi:hypothetical protein